MRKLEPWHDKPGTLTTGVGVRLTLDERAKLERIGASRTPPVKLATLMREASRDLIARELGDDA